VIFLSGSGEHDDTVRPVHHCGGGVHDGRPFVRLRLDSGYRPACLLGCRPAAALTMPSRSMIPASGLADMTPAGGEAPAHAIRLVLVEDDHDFREAAAAELEDLGFEVECFADGAAMLDGFAAGATADMIVLDWDLPGPSGLDLIPRLRRAGVLLPVIMLTGRSTPRLESRVVAVRQAHFRKQASMSWPKLNFPFLLTTVCLPVLGLISRSSETSGPVAATIGLSTPSVRTSDGDGMPRGRHRA